MIFDTLYLKDKFMNNCVLNETFEDAISFVSYKINLDGKIYYVKEFQDRTGKAIDTRIYDLVGEVKSKTIYHDLFKIIKNHKAA